MTKVFADVDADKKELMEAKETITAQALAHETFIKLYYSGHGIRF